MRRDIFRTKTGRGWRVAWPGRDGDSRASQEAKRWEDRGKAMVMEMGMRGTEPGQDNGQEVVATGCGRGQEGGVKATSRVSGLGG